MKTDYTFPYSTDPDEKREQIWKNLQKGILLEDTLTFIPWLTQYKDIDKYAERRSERGDRTVWYLGERKILNGLSSQIEVLKWLPQPETSTFDQFYDNLGYDSDGQIRFHNRIDFFTELLGQPDKKEMEKFGSFDLGIVHWTRDKVRISAVGIEHFNCRYKLNIGLIDNSHDQDHNKAIDELRAQGWTEEDFGK
jgi:hypothetical protein